MQRNCAVCGKPFQAQRPQARYCGATCRKRAQRGGLAASKAPVVPIPAPVVAEESEDSGPGLVEAVRSALVEAGRLHTVPGQHAMELARRIVNAPGMNTGVSALSKQLQAVMTEALSGAVAAADPVDELRARRDRKRGRLA